MSFITLEDINGKIHRIDSNEITQSVWRGEEVHVTTARGDLMVLKASEFSKIRDAMDRDR